MMRDSCDSWGSFSVSTSHASAYGNFSKTACKLSQLSQPAMEIDVNGLVALVAALAARCACERGEPREDCAPPINRWWVAIIAGHESENDSNGAAPQTRSGRLSQ